MAHGGLQRRALQAGCQSQHAGVGMNKVFRWPDQHRPRWWNIRCFVQESAGFEWGGAIALALPMVFEAVVTCHPRIFWGPPLLFSSGVATLAVELHRVQRNLPEATLLVAGDPHVKLLRSGDNGIDPALVDQRARGAATERTLDLHTGGANTAQPPGGERLSFASQT